MKIKLFCFLFPLLVLACATPTTTEKITFNTQSNSQVAAAGTVDFTITGLTDTQAYRITLVVAANLTTSGDGKGTFVDADKNGAADAGASENIALITKVNGEAVTGAKTVPAGTDNPASPTGIFPKSGTITLTVTGVAAGKVYPVIYHNGGTSTFLELDSAGMPTETYIVGSAVIVQ
ncbi:MAG: hypothetical protein H6728_04365 [Myxococcales bacterium]|nr:hypothetical protein [Myxococcales bacterium]MCB9642286.1 hypothetical protein [Myxococcales bacterium]